MLKEGRPCTKNNDNSFDNALATDLSPDELPKILSWIRENLTPSEDVCHDKGSYNLKHDLENDIGIYMTNNQFKDAMLLCGFKAYNTDDINWKFYISPESALFKKNKPAMKDRFKKLRMELADFAGKNISQAEFAKYFHIPVSTYQKWEQGAMEPPEYIYQMIDDFTCYWDILWKKGIPDSVIHRSFEENLMAQEHEIEWTVNSCSNYFIYDEKADPENNIGDKKNCRTMHFYPDTLYKIQNGLQGIMGNTADVFKDLYEVMFKRFDVVPFVSYEEVLEVMQHGTLGCPINFRFSVGYDCNHKIYAPEDDNVFAMLTASGHDSRTYTKFYDIISNPELTNKQCKGIVWFCDGSRHVIS